MSPIVVVIIIVVEAIVALGVGGYVGLVYQRRQTAAKDRELGLQARGVLQEAESKAKDTLLKAGGEALKVRNAAEEEAVRRLADLGKEDQRLLRRRGGPDRKTE